MSLFGDTAISKPFDFEKSNNKAKSKGKHAKSDDRESHEDASQELM